MRLFAEFWRKEAGLIRVTGTINLLNNILNTKALGRKIVRANLGEAVGNRILNIRNWKSRHPIA